MSNTETRKTITLTPAEIAERAALAAEFAAEIAKCDDCGTEITTGTVCARCAQLHRVMGY